MTLPQPLPLDSARGGLRNFQPLGSVECDLISTTAAAAKTRTFFKKNLINILVHGIFWNRLLDFHLSLKVGIVKDQQ